MNSHAEGPSPGSSKSASQAVRPPDEEPLTQLDAARRELRANEYGLSIFIDGVKEYEFMLLDPAGFILVWNRGAEEVTGYTREEAIGQHFAMLLPPGDVVTGKPSELLRQAEEAGSIQVDGWRMRKDRSKYWGRMSINTVGCSRGLVQYFCCTTKDQTHEKSSNDELVENELRFRTTFEYASIGMALVAPNGQWLQVNRALCNIVGYSPNDLLSGQLRGLTHPQDAGLDDEQQRRCLAGEISTYNIEKRYIHSQGHVVWVLRSVSLVRDSLGRPAYFISQVQDITERKRSEAALRYSEERYRLLSDNVTDLITRQSLDGTFEYVSNSSVNLLGFVPSDLVGKNVYDLITPEDINLVQSFHVQVLRSEEPHTYCYRALKPDGTAVWLETTSQSIRDRESGNTHHILSVSRDISQRKQMEKMIDDQMSQLNDKSLLLEMQQVELEELNEQLEKLATTDGLTSVRNRRTFQQLLEAETSRSRETGASLSLILLDVDHFKKFNDQFGHQHGDEVLIRVARTLEASVRQHDVVARYGGEEFVVILPDTNREQALRAAEHVRAAIEDQEWPLRQVTASFGVATWSPRTETESQFIEIADQGLYASKGRGRNCVTHGDDVVPGDQQKAA